MLMSGDPFTAKGSVFEVKANALYNVRAVVSTTVTRG